MLHFFLIVCLNSWIKIVWGLARKRFQLGKEFGSCEDYINDDFHTGRHLPIGMIPIAIRHLPIDIGMRPIAIIHLPIDIGMRPIEIIHLPIDIGMRPIAIRHLPIDICRYEPEWKKHFTPYRLCSKGSQFGSNKKNLGHQLGESKPPMISCCTLPSPTPFKLSFKFQIVHFWSKGWFTQTVFDAWGYGRSVWCRKMENFLFLLKHNCLP